MLTTEQLAQRRTGIGASEIAMVAGLSPFGGPMAVFASKVRGVEKEETVAMQAGSFLEDSAARWYSKREHVRLSARPATYRHAKYPWALATPDRFGVVGRPTRPERIVEVKNVTSRYSAAEWGEPGTDKIPQAYLCQVHWQMEVCDLPRADVVALFFGRDLQVYRVERDREFAADLLEVGRAFWENHVVPGIAPALDGSDAGDRYLRAKFPRLAGGVVAAPVEAEEWARKYDAAADAEKSAEKEKKLAAQYLKLIIGENEGVEGPWGRCTWKHAAGRTDWAALARSLGATEQQIKDHTPVGDRRFHLHLKNEEE